MMIRIAKKRIAIRKGNEKTICYVYVYICSVYVYLFLIVFILCNVI